jgi:hypothetical protein
MSWALAALFCLGLYWATSGVLKWQGMRAAVADRTQRPVTASQFSLNEVVRQSRYRWVEYVPSIQYTYQVGNQQLQGDRIFLVGAIGHSSKEKMLQFMKQMDVSAAFVKNGDPSDAFLIPTPSPAWRSSMLGVTASGLLLMGVTAALFVLLS